MQGEHRTADLAERREAVAGATAAVSGLDAHLFQAGGGDLGVLLGELDALESACGAAKVAVVAEAVSRGETTGGPAALTAVGWVRHHAPSTRAGGAAQLVSVAAAFDKPANAPVREAVRTGRIPVRSAAVVMTEAERLQPRLADGAEPHVLEGLIAMAALHGPRGCRMVRPALLARYGLQDELQAEQDTAKRFVALSQPHDTGTGVFEYRLALDAEGKTVLEAALGSLSAPRPTGGERDLRSSDQRRGDALVAIVRRAVAAADGVPTTAKAQLFVTIDHERLASRLRGHCPTCGHATPDIPSAARSGPDGPAAGTVVGGPDAGTLLAPETVRRLGCDASIIPIVLGSRGEVLDWGGEKRLFTPAQTKRLWLRDGGCTYPGCSMPAQWTDGHHLIHWADGGPTDLANAALLCERHHTTVHSRRLAGTLVRDEDGERIEWDLTRGSYDTLLAHRQSRRRA